MRAQLTQAQDPCEDLRVATFPRTNEHSYDEERTSKNTTHFFTKVLFRMNRLI